MPWQPPQASFATTEVKFGIIPAAISPYGISAIGPRHASRYFLTAERFNAQEALRIGMVHAICPPEVLDSQVRQLTDALIVGGPNSQAAAKELIRAVAFRTLGDEMIDDSAQRIGKLGATPEAKEGIGAFLEKRPPSWTGE